MHRRPGHKECHTYLSQKKKRILKRGCGVATKDDGLKKRDRQREWVDVLGGKRTVGLLDKREGENKMNQRWIVRKEVVEKRAQ